MKLAELLGSNSRKRPDVLTPQTEILRGRASEMTLNAAGGYNFKLSHEEAFERFLVLGIIENTYYVQDRNMGQEVLQLLDILLEKNPYDFVDTVVRVSTSGAALKTSQAIFALARAVSRMTGDKLKDTNQNDATSMARAYALKRAPEVLRTLSQTFEFLDYCRRQRGAGSGLTKLLANSLTQRSYRNAEYQVLKYGASEKNQWGWTTRDLVRFAHPKTPNSDVNGLLAWVVNKESAAARAHTSNSPRLDAYESIRVPNAPSVDHVCSMILQHGLTHEMIPNTYLSHSQVWEALIADSAMNHIAFIRNLRKMVRLGLFEDQNGSAMEVARDMLLSADKLRAGRVHPLRLMMAHRGLKSGTDRRGNHFATPRHLLDLLDKAITLSFSVVEPTGKRILIAIDDSGSMGSPVTNDGMSAREAAAAMAAYYVQTEKHVDLITFTTRADEVILPDDRSTVTPALLHTLIRSTARGTDCAQPFIWANKNNRDYDVIIQITDSHSWAGDMHASVAADVYRKAVGHDVIAVAAATSYEGQSILDPKDKMSLNAIGFDATVPQAIAAFIKGVSE